MMEEPGRTAQNSSRSAIPAFEIPENS